MPKSIRLISLVSLQVFLITSLVNCSKSSRFSFTPRAAYQNSMTSGTVKLTISSPGIYQIEDFIWLRTKKTGENISETSFVTDVVTNSDGTKNINKNISIPLYQEWESHVKVIYRDKNSNELIEYISNKSGPYMATKDNPSINIIHTINIDKSAVEEIHLSGITDTTITFNSDLNSLPATTTITLDADTRINTIEGNVTSGNCSILNPNNLASKDILTPGRYTFDVAVQDIGTCAFSFSGDSNNQFHIFETLAADFLVTSNENVSSDENVNTGDVDQTAKLNFHPYFVDTSGVYSSNQKADVSYAISGDTGIIVIKLQMKDDDSGFPSSTYAPEIVTENCPTPFVLKSTFIDSSLSTATWEFESQFDSTLNPSVTCGAEFEIADSLGASLYTDVSIDFTYTDTSSSSKFSFIGSVSPSSPQFVTAKFFTVSNQGILKQGADIRMDTSNSLDYLFQLSYPVMVNYLLAGYAFQIEIEDSTGTVIEKINLNSSGTTPTIRPIYVSESDNYEIEVDDNANGVFEISTVYTIK